MTVRIRLIVFCRNVNVIFNKQSILEKDFSVFVTNVSAQRELDFSNMKEYTQKKEYSMIKKIKCYSEEGRG